MAYPEKCCRSTPRCRDCPARRPLDPAMWTGQAELIALVTPRADLPTHLVGVPRCLHKYEPLLRRSETDGEREPQAVVSAPPS